MAGRVIQGFFMDGRPRVPVAAIQPKATTLRIGPPAPAFAPSVSVVQRRGGSETFKVDPARLGLATGGGRPLPEAVRSKMEAVFGADFSAVRVHIGPQSERIGAFAFTAGTDIYFAPGRYQPDTPTGQKLLGHELSHVVQQRQGRVRAPGASGLAVVLDQALEAEADRMGQRAAIATAPHSGPSPAGSAARPTPSITALQPMAWWLAAGLLGTAAASAAAAWWWWYSRSRTGSAPDRLSALPNELLGQISDYLSPTDRAKLSETSSGMRDRLPLVAPFLVAMRNCALGRNRSDARGGISASQLAYLRRCRNVPQLTKTVELSHSALGGGSYHPRLKHVVTFGNKNQPGIRVIRFVRAAKVKCIIPGKRVLQYSMQWTVPGYVTMENQDFNVDNSDMQERNAKLDSALDQAWAHAAWSFDGPHNEGLGGGTGTTITVEDTPGDTSVYLPYLIRTSFVIVLFHEPDGRILQVASYDHENAWWFAPSGATTAPSSGGTGPSASRRDDVGQHKKAGDLASASGRRPGGK